MDLGYCQWRDFVLEPMVAKILSMSYGNLCSVTYQMIWSPFHRGTCLPHDKLSHCLLFFSPHFVTLDGMNCKGQFIMIVQYELT